MQHIDFLDIFIHCELEYIEKHGKILCPFCGKYAFVVYPDAKSYCHNCKFAGNAITFCSKVKDVSYDDALAELTVAYRGNKIKLRPKSPKEALKGLRDDLHYLATVRMYFEFYKGGRKNKRYYQQLSGIPQATFSRVINGDIVSTSKEEGNKALVFLRSKINIEQFKEDLAKGAMYFNDEAYELLKSQSHKFR